jgi:YbgC/YbaW family acyl-CoA thioester hydrolase
MQQQLATERGLQFMVLRAEVDYRAAARLDDRLSITVEPRPDTRTTALFRQCVFREPADGVAADRELLVEALVRVVCVDAKTLRPRRISEYIP